MDPAESLARYRRRADRFEWIIAATPDPLWSAQSPCDELSVADMVDEVVSQDLVHHGWDLAKATRQDAAMHGDDVDELLPVVAALPPEVYVPEAYGPDIVVLGPKDPVPDDAPAQDQLLGLLGRDPHWVAR